MRLTCLCRYSLKQQAKQCLYLARVKLYWSLLGLSRPNRSPTTQPNRPTPTRFWPKPKVQSVGNRFPFSRTNTCESSSEFASPKSEQPKPDQSHIKKSSQICKNKLALARSQLDLARSRPNLVRSRQDPARFGGI